MREAIPCSSLGRGPATATAIRYITCVCAISSTALLVSLQPLSSAGSSTTTTAAHCSFCRSWSGRWAFAFSQGPIISLRAAAHRPTTSRLRRRKRFRPIRKDIAMNVRHGRLKDNMTQAGQEEFPMLTEHIFPMKLLFLFPWLLLLFVTARWDVRLGRHILLRTL